MQNPIRFDDREWNRNTKSSNSIECIQLIHWNTFLLALVEPFPRLYKSIQCIDAIIAHSSTNKSSFKLWHWESSKWYIIVMIIRTAAMRAKKWITKLKLCILPLIWLITAQLNDAPPYVAVHQTAWSTCMCFVMSTRIKRLWCWWKVTETKRTISCNLLWKNGCVWLCTRAERVPLF